ncbi:hypothetical protein ERO13_A09G207850v2, partial [Gossypium hirsutum]
MPEKIFRIDLCLDLHQSIKVVLEIFTTPNTHLCISRIPIFIIFPDIEISIIHISFSWRFRYKRLHVTVKSPHPSYIPFRIYI